MGWLSGGQAGCIFTTMDCGVHSTLKSKVASHLRQGGGVCSLGGTYYVGYQEGAIILRTLHTVYSPHDGLRDVPAIIYTPPVACRALKKRPISDSSARGWLSDDRPSACARQRSWPSLPPATAEQNLACVTRTNVVREAFEKEYLFSTPFSIFPTWRLSRATSLNPSTLQKSQDTSAAEGVGLKTLNPKP